MKISLESTTRVVTVNGVPARIWEGRSESGVSIHAYVTRIAVPKDAPTEEHERFARELQECRPPSPDLTIPLRLIL